MIHTDIDIKDELYGWLRGSALAGMVSGSVYKDSRPLNSVKEDITIAVLARDAGSQMQEAIVNVNIYVPDVRRGKEAVEDSVRLRSLCAEAAGMLAYRHTGDCIVELTEQSVIQANGIDWHVINNRLRVRYNNEEV